MFDPYATASSFISSKKKYGLGFTLFIVLIYFGPSIISQISPRGDTTNNTQNNSPQQNVKQEVNFCGKPEENSALGTESRAEPSLYSIEENSDAWDVSFLNFRKTENDFCPKNKTAFEYQIMWYRIPIPVVGIDLTVKLILHDENPKKSVNQSVVFSMGKNPKISELILPIGQSQVVNFRQSAPGEKELEFIYEGQALDSQIMKNTNVEINLKTQIKTGNTVQYLYTVKYISALNQKNLENVFSYDVRLGDADPVLLTTDIGFGVFNGSCIQLLYFNY